MDDLERFKRMTDRLCELHKKKNESYGNAYGEVLDAMGKNGIYHATGQLYAKMKRLLSMTTKDELDTFGESIEDSIIDMVSYGIMTLVAIEKQKSKD